MTEQQNQKQQAIDLLGSRYRVMENASIMLQRNLLYTAITCAKKICIVVGTWRAIHIAVQNWMIKPRWTYLKELIKE